MPIDVIPYASAIRPDLISGKTVVIIDVLRASSVMITALANGALSFVPASTVLETKKLAKHFQNDNILLAGERNTKIISGFHLGNSPLDYTRKKVEGKKIIITTSNGTHALVNVKDAEKVFIGAFINARAVALAIKKCSNTVLICAGTNNTFSLDDGMCAAMIIDKILKNNTVELSDFAIALYKAYKSEKNDLRKLLKNCYHLNLLVKNGFETDVDYCLQEDKYDIVPEMKNGEIKLTL